MFKPLLIIIFLFFIQFAYPQQITHQSNYRINGKADAGNSIILSSLLVLTPTLVLNDSKAYFGLSKELSIGKFPYGRAEIDYTYIFRNERSSALHLSYNADIPLNGSFKDPSLFMISPGAGYYTDFTQKGYFIQAALGLWVSTGFMEGLSIHPNIKARKVFMQNDLPGMFEVSLGIGFGFYSR